jgi:hypothetical protein
MQKVEILKREKRGRLLLLELLPREQWYHHHHGTPHPVGLFQCDCGVVKPIQIDNVWGTNHSRSCGCYKLEVISQRSWTGCGELSGSFWRGVRFNARIRSIKLDITKEQAWGLFIKQERKCAYTGWELVFTRDWRKANKQQTASLDRIIGPHRQ